MTKTELSHFSMGLKVNTNFGKNSKIWKADKILCGFITELDATLAEIKTTEIKQKSSIKGITLEKNKYRKTLNNTTEIILNIICAYASNTGNAEIYQKFDIPDSSVAKMKDAQFPMLAQDVDNYIKENKDALKPYGITDELIKKYDSQTASYNDYLAKPAQAKGEVAEATEKIKRLIKSMMQLFITKIDKSMKPYSETYPDFYNDYVEARYIYDMPTHHLSIKGTITDADTGLPIFNVTVRVRKFKGGTETATKVKCTSKKGIYEFKHLESGLWEVIIEKTFYETYTVEIDIEPNTMYKLNIKLKKIKAE